MRDCVSHLELLRWEARPEAERSPDASAHLRTCARCAAALAELVSARQELLGVDPMPRALSQLARSWRGWRNGAARHGGDSSFRLRSPRWLPQPCCCSW